VQLSLEALEGRPLLSACHVSRLGDADMGMANRGTLRYCVNYVNQNFGPDTIDFKVTGTIVLNSPLPLLSTEITIIGPGANLSAVDAQYDRRVFEVPSTGVVSISGLTATHGYVDFQGAGILNKGTLTLDSCAVSDNTTDNHSFELALGGGISNTGRLTVRNSTVSGNRTFASEAQADYGAGFYNSGSLLVENSTISGNHGDFYDTYGGGIYNAPGGTARLNFTTVTANKGDGVGDGGGIGNAGSLSLHDTIVAGNSPGDMHGGYTGNHNLIGGDPKVGVLQYNGGPTMTHKLLAQSPAIDAGDNTGAPDWDQRGPGYPRIVNGTVDIGSYEVQGNGTAPAGGRSAWATAPLTPPATLRVSQPPPAQESHQQPVFALTGVAAPGAAEKPADPLVRADHVPAAVPVSDADPLGLGW
jgi:hypothetical protein